MTEGLKWTLNEVPKSDDTFLDFTKASPSIQ